MFTNPFYTHILEHWHTFQGLLKGPAKFALGYFKEVVKQRASLYSAEWLHDSVEWLLEDQLLGSRFTRMDEWASIRSNGSHSGEWPMQFGRMELPDSKLCLNIVDYAEWHSIRSNEESIGQMGSSFCAISFIR